MQSFPLPRLPFLAIREVIKSMNIREILYLSVISKKSQNLVTLSIPKNSLSAEFTFKIDGLIFEVMPKGLEKGAVEILPVYPFRTEKESVFTSFSSCGLYVHSELCYTSEVEDIRKLFHRFSKTFKNSKISMEFENGTREKFAMEVLRFAWENGFQLDYIEFCLQNASPESIRELLNGCHEHCTSLDIKTTIPIGFKCTPPPGGYKFEYFSVDYAHWINPDDVLQCRRVAFKRWHLNLSPKYLNGLLKKIVNLESRIESFVFTKINPSDFPAIVAGLSESEIMKMQEVQWQGLQFERKDGLKLLVYLNHGYIHLDAR